MSGPLRKVIIDLFTTIKEIGSKKEEGNATIYEQRIADLIKVIVVVMPKTSDANYEEVCEDACSIIHEHSEKLKMSDGEVLLGLLSAMIMVKQRPSRPRFTIRNGFGDQIDLHDIDTEVRMLWNVPSASDGQYAYPIVNGAELVSWANMFDDCLERERGIDSLHSLLLYLRKACTCEDDEARSKCGVVPYIRAVEHLLSRGYILSKSFDPFAAYEAIIRGDTIRYN